MERKSFGIENFNFGLRRHDTPELNRVCRVLRNGGAQLFTLQEANTIFMDAVLQGGRVPGDPKWKPKRYDSGAASSSDAVPNSAVVTATHEERPQQGTDTGQIAPSSANAATAVADTSSSVVTEKAADHEIYFVYLHEGYNQNGEVPTLAFAARSNLVKGLKMKCFYRFIQGIYMSGGKK